MQTATNHETGERVVLIGGEWKPIERSATNAKGEKSFLIGGEWVADAPEAKPEEMSVLDRAKRVAGLGARSVVTGVTAIPTLMADAVAGGVNTGIEGMNWAFNKVTPTSLRDLVTGRKDLIDYRMQAPSAVLQRYMTNAGLPEPASAVERFSTDVTSGLASGASVIKMGDLMRGATSPVVSGIGEMLATRPGLQTLANATGSGSASLAREAGGGPISQAISGVVGAIAPSAVGYGAQAGVRAFMRGGEEGRQAVKSNLKTFADAGYGTPSVGQATEARIPRAIESGLAKTPGGAGVMAKAAEKGSASLGQRVEEIADDLSPGSTSTKAGAAIEHGVEKFVEGFRSKQNTLFGKLDTFIPKDKPVDMTNTANALASLNADIAGAPALSKFFKNSTIQAIESAMKSDTGDFTKRLPYEAMKKLRTLVGQEIENTNLTSSVPRSKWRSLYSALSEDMGEAAKAAGSDAQKAYQRANTYTAAGHQRIGDYLNRVAGKDTVEKVFQAAVNPSEIKEGASTLNAVMRSIPETDRKIVQSAFIRRLGTATAGKQDEVGELFSPETFLTNWNKVSPEAKQTLFAGKSGQLRTDLDQIASVAANLREGTKVFANPSGTQQALSNQFAGGGFLIALVTGHLEVAAAIAGTAGGANLAARAMTSPKVVRFLAGTTEVPYEAIPAVLNSLAQQSEKWPEADREAAQGLIEASGKAIGRQAQAAGQQ